jgi:uncharacterized protein YkwD
MNRCLIIVTALGFLAVACGEGVDNASLVDPGVDSSSESSSQWAQTRHQAVGEPRDGYPSHNERVVLYLTNRARTEPDAFNPEEPYPATPPLRFDLNLSKAARFHAQHIIDAGCWCEDHSSCCPMEEAAEGGQCAGPSTGCGATMPGERVAYWSSNYTGENQAQGYQTAHAVLDGWIHSSGHWQNINSSTHNLLGSGEYNTGWVQDFGAGSGARPVAADGIHFTDQTNQTFGITYFQPGTGGPRTILAIVDGQCHDLDLAYGQPELGAFETTLSLEPGCHRYYFHITDGDGNNHVYPSQGSLGAVVGSAEDCPLFSENRPADTCSPSGQSCETGHTRPCYNGPWGSEGSGICEAGVERCVGRQWTGECRLQTLPEDTDICDNGLDDDCDGTIDDGCGGGGEVGDAGSSDAGSGDASGDLGVRTGGGSSSTGCTTSSGATPVPLAPLASLALMLVLVAARRVECRVS